jgi:hypothetical protein
LCGAKSIGIELIFARACDANVIAADSWPLVDPCGSFCPLICPCTPIQDEQQKKASDACLSMALASAQKF